MAAIRSDVVIGYNKDDLEFVIKLADKLRKCNLSAWYPGPGETASKTSDAILACKVFLPVMTEASAVDSVIQEELSLAYISNSAIFPLSRIRYRYLSPKLSGGAKLMLAKINWCFVFNMEEFEDKTDILVAAIKRDLESIAQQPSDTPRTIETHGITVGERSGEGFEDDDEMGLPDTGSQDGFWDRHFNGCNEVTWSKFKNKFLADYGAKIEEIFAQNPEERKKVVLKILKADVFTVAESGSVRRSQYDEFVPKDGPHALFHRLQQYGLAYTSLRKLLAMDSSLRISTIQGLGQYNFPAVVHGLADMLKDEDPNIRAVAAIALAHAGEGTPTLDVTVEALLSVMEDEDRLVREAACLSLGYLRSTKAVPHIVDRWRNDPISHVREAAELALSKLEAQATDARRSIKVAQVLSSEMKALKPQE